MPLGFGSHTSGARFNVFLDEFAESRPGIVATDEVNGLVLSRMSGKDVIVLVVENTEPEVIGVRNIDKVVMTEETIRSNGPAGLRFFLVGNVKRVVGKCGQDVDVELFLVHDNCCTENWSNQFRSTE